MLAALVIHRVFGFGIWCHCSVVGFLHTKYRGFPDRPEGKAEYLGLLMTRALQSQVKGCDQA